MPAAPVQDAAQVAEAAADGGARHPPGARRRPHPGAPALCGRRAGRCTAHRLPRSAPTPRRSSPRPATREPEIDRPRARRESLGWHRERHAARRDEKGPLPAPFGRPAFVDARRADARRLGHPPRDRRPARRDALHRGEHVPVRRHRPALARHGQDLGAHRGDRSAGGDGPDAREDVARAAGQRAR